MIERITTGFHPFVLPFLFGMIFILSWCVGGIIRVLCQLSSADRRKFLISLVTPKTVWKNIRDIFLNCLIHVKLWKKNPVLGYMHSSIAFGWFMIIVLGHLEVMLFLPSRMRLFYYPIFFNFFVAESANPSIGGSVLFFLMDFFLAVILSGIVLAMIKRVRSRWFGMRRTTRPSLPDMIGLYSLWSIFPLRLLAEAFTAHISGGSFLTLPLNWLFRLIAGSEVTVLLPMMPTWWAYSIVLGVFLTVLPFTRYMHIPAEMMLIPMRNAGLKVEHARRGFAKVMVFSCPGCGVCIDACPMSVKAANTKDTTVYLNRQIRRANERRIEEISDKCLLCGKCSEVCQIGIDGPGLRIKQRAFRQYGLQRDFSNITPASLSANVERTSVRSSSHAQVLYFAGCMTALTPRISVAVEKVLKAARIDYDYLDRDGGLCCGRPLMTAGRIDEARQLIEKTRALILESGCKTLLLSCPICYKIFKEEYKLEEEGIRVVHHSEYFNELVNTGRLPLKEDAATAGSAATAVPEKIAYHDPCELGRGSGIYEEPRQLLSHCGKVVESREHHEKSICCGGSVGSLTLSFAQREAITKNALRNLMFHRPAKIATACPLCLATFARYADRPVYDIAEILAAKL